MKSYSEVFKSRVRDVVSYELEYNDLYTTGIISREDNGFYWRLRFKSIEAINEFYKDLHIPSTLKRKIMNNINRISNKNKLYLDIVKNLMDKISITDKECIWFDRRYNALYNQD